MLAFASPIVDTSALWKIILASFAGGAGVAVAFGILVLGVSRAQSTESGAVRALNYGVVLLAGAFCIAAVVLGIHAMTTKS
jgi:quinol-cytochrome oxidoreductase complex cytochrome b subunit